MASQRHLERCETEIARFSCFHGFLISKHATEADALYGHKPCAKRIVKVNSNQLNNQITEYAPCGSTMFFNR